MSSSQQVQGQRKHHTDTTAAREVAAFFARLGTADIHPRLRGITGSSQFNIEGAGRWRVAIKDGVVSVAEAGAMSTTSTMSTTGATTASTDAVVTATAADMARILRGEGHLNAFSAGLQEIMTVRGDPAFTASLLDVFSFGQGGTQGGTQSSTDT
jgi:hypothetical protein